MTTGTEVLDSYAALLANVQPRSITSDAEAAAIQSRIDQLIDQPVRTADEDALLSLLGDLMQVWEGDRYDLTAPTPPEAIRALLEAHGYAQQDLVGTVFATKSIASEVLHGKRGLTYDHAGRLARFFHVSPEVFYRGSTPA
jgi:HTH-type transcriptional regulator/antitoxin HigA